MLLMEKIRKMGSELVQVVIKYVDQGKPLMFELRLGGSSRSWSILFGLFFFLFRIF